MSRIDRTFHDKRLDSTSSTISITWRIHIFTELALCGIGVHHAGMTLDDRRTTEDLYLSKLLRVVVATSVSLYVVRYIMRLDVRLR